MQIALSKVRLLELVLTQVRNNFLLEPGEDSRLEARLDEALRRSEVCFDATPTKYYRRDGETFFNPYHSAQYCIFLYFLSRTLWQAGGNSILCDKIYCLNKMLNGLDLFYEVEMPEVFYTDHPVGSVMGRARYGLFFRFNQNCTVGNNKGKYPTLGENVRMFSASRILGDCTIGDNVIVSSGSFIKDTNIPPCHIVFGQSPNLVLKSRPAEYFARPNL